MKKKANYVPNAIDKQPNIIDFILYEAKWGSEYTSDTAVCINNVKFKGAILMSYSKEEILL